MLIASLDKNFIERNTCLTNNKLMKQHQELQGVFEHWKINSLLKEIVKENVTCYINWALMINHPKQMFEMDLIMSN